MQTNRQFSTDLFASTKDVFIAKLLVLIDSAHIREENDHAKPLISYTEILHTHNDWPEPSPFVCVMKYVTCGLAFSIFLLCLFPGHLHLKFVNSHLPDTRS